MKKLMLFIGLLAQVAVVAQKTQGLALTPPMGWNSWNKFACEINEKLIRETADGLVQNGFKEAGYEYIVIDDCWQIARDKDGNILADSAKFPSGIKALADYVHAKGLKFGIYSCAGKLTCGKRPGSNGYEVRDANTYASWGVDYVKYDWCNTEGIDAKVAYTNMSNALTKTGRPMIFSLCEWGYNRPWEWAKNVGHLWRTTVDIDTTFDYKKVWWKLGWATILDMQEGLDKYAGPGHWNDPDMLQVGNGGMNYNEYAAHFSFWCLLAAPLMAGNDLRSVSDSIKTILLNRDAIAVNQDKAGIQGKKVFDDGDFEIHSKLLANGDKAIIFFNRNERTFEFAALWEKAGIKADMEVYDIWKHKVIGTTKTIKKVKVEGHSVLFYRVKSAT